MLVCRRTESASVESDSEVLVMFVKVDGDSTARHISEWYNFV